MLVFDMRTRYNYYQCHLENSISLPLDLCHEDEFFIKWDPLKISTEIIQNKEKKKAFDDRKRRFIYIIASQTDLNEEIEYRAPSIFNTDILKKYFKKYGKGKMVGNGSSPSYR